MKKENNYYIFNLYKFQFIKVQKIVVFSATFDNAHQELETV